MKKLLVSAAVLSLFAVLGAVACLLWPGSVRMGGEDPAKGKAGKPSEGASCTRKSAGIEPSVPPSAHDPEVARFVNREAQDRVTADISTRLPSVEHPDDVKAVVSVLLDTQDDDTVRHEAASLLHRSNYASLTDDLLQVLNNPAEKERFRSFVIQHLWTQTEKAPPAERAKITDVLHASIADRHTAVRREALLVLVRMKDAQGIETAVKGLYESAECGVRGAEYGPPGAKAPSPGARPPASRPPSPAGGEGMLDLCVRIVRAQNLREHLPRVRELLRSPNDDVKRQAMVTVGEWGDEESRPALEEAAKSDKPLVKSAATAALKRLDAARASP